VTALLVHKKTRPETRAKPVTDVCHSCHILLHVPVSAGDKSDGPCKMVFTFIPPRWVFNFGKTFMKNVLIRKQKESKKRRNYEVNGVL
jgi:hypothetical protein